MPDAPFVEQEALDLLLNELIDSSDRVVYLTGDPTDFSDADTLASSGGKKIGERNLSNIGFDGPSDNGTGGRQSTLLKAGFVADDTGNVTRLALLDDTNDSIVQVFEVDDGSGNPVSATEGLAYNNLDTVTEVTV